MRVPISTEPRLRNAIDAPSDNVTTGLVVDDFGEALQERRYGK
jgi:hypothetical protein